MRKTFATFAFLVMCTQARASLDAYTGWLASQPRLEDAINRHEVPGKIGCLPSSGRSPVGVARWLLSPSSGRQIAALTVELTGRRVRGERR